MSIPRERERDRTVDEGKNDAYVPSREAMSAVKEIRDKPDRQIHESSLTAVNKEIRRVFDDSNTNLDALELILGDLPINLHESVTLVRSYKLAPIPCVPTYYNKLIPIDQNTFKKIAGGVARSKSLTHVARKIPVPGEVIDFFFRNVEEISGVLAAQGPAAAAAGGAAGGGLNNFPIINLKRLFAMATVVRTMTIGTIMDGVIMNEVIRTNYGLWMRVALIDHGVHNAWVPDVSEKILAELMTMDHRHGPANNSDAYKYVLIYVFGGAQGFPAGSDFAEFDSFMTNIHNAGVPNRSLLARFLLSTLKEILYTVRGPLANPTINRWQDARAGGGRDNGNNALGNGYAANLGMW